MEEQKPTYTNEKKWPLIWPPHGEEIANLALLVIGWNLALCVLVMLSNGFARLDIIYRLLFALAVINSSAILYWIRVFTTRRRLAYAEMIVKPQSITRFVVDFVAQILWILIIIAFFFLVARTFQISIWVALTIACGVAVPTAEHMSFQKVYQWWQNQPNIH